MTIWKGRSSTRTAVPSQVSGGRATSASGSSWASVATTEPIEVPKVIVAVVRLPADS